MRMASLLFFSKRPLFFSHFFLGGGLYAFLKKYVMGASLMAIGYTHYVPKGLKCLDLDNIGPRPRLGLIFWS